jgi:hypothetical protein
LDEFRLFVVWIVEICPEQDVKSKDTNSEQSIEFLSLQIIISLNIFVIVSKCSCFEAVAIGCSLGFANRRSQ